MATDRLSNYYVTNAVIMILSAITSMALLLLFMSAMDCFYCDLNKSVWYMSLQKYFMYVT